MADKIVVANLTDPSAEERDLAASYALRVLDGDEQAEFESHLASCGNCQALVREYRQVASNLVLLAPEMEASASFREELFDRAQTEGAAGGAVGVPPKAPITQGWGDKLRLFSPVPRWATALAAVLVVGLLVLGDRALENQVVAGAPLQGNVQGSARAELHRSGETDLQLTGLQSPPSGYVYEGWLIGAGGRAQPAGTISDGTGVLPLEGDARGAVVALTEERAPGTSAPSSAPLLATQDPL